MNKMSDVLLCCSGHQSKAQRKKVSTAAGSPELNGAETPRCLKKVMKLDDIYLLDARQEGNVSRFLNVGEHVIYFLKKI